jgi:hypothetical protein
MKYLQRRAAGNKWSQLRGEVTGTGLPPPLGAHNITLCSSGAGHGVKGFEVSLATFQSLPRYSPIPPFCSGNVYSVPLCVRYNLVFVFFVFLQGLTVKSCVEYLVSDALSLFPGVMSSHYGSFIE